MALADQWEDDHDVDASGYDQDFIWMAAEVFWSRWASDLPYRERITTWYRKAENSVSRATTPRLASNG